MTFIANSIFANQDSYVNFQSKSICLYNNPYSFYDNIYLINKPNQDLVPFKSILNQNNRFKFYYFYKNFNENKSMLKKKFKDRTYIEFQSDLLNLN